MPKSRARCARRSSLLASYSLSNSSFPRRPPKFAQERPGEDSRSPRAEVTFAPAPSPSCRPISAFFRHAQEVSISNLASRRVSGRSERRRKRRPPPTLCTAASGVHFSSEKLGSVSRPDFLIRTKKKVYEGLK